MLRPCLSAVSSRPNGSASTLSFSTLLETLSSSKGDVVGSTGSGQADDGGPFDASTLPFGRELKAERLSIDPEPVEGSTRLRAPPRKRDLRRAGSPLGSDRPATCHLPLATCHLPKSTHRLCVFVRYSMNLPVFHQHDETV